MTIDICLPAYNEELILKINTIKLLNYLNTLKDTFDWHVYIVINGSSDNSLGIAKELSENNNKISVHELKQGGKGRAIKYCWQKSEANYFIYMDMDLAVSLQSLPELIESLEQDYDLVWGSRHLKDSKVKRSIFRSFSSLMYNIFSKTVLKHSYSDLQCGFKGINNRIKNKVIEKTKDNNWFFDTELIIWSKSFNFKLKEIPVEWEEEKYQGRKSKVNVFKDTKSFINKTIKLRKNINRINK